jgi:hypothetical protein
MVILDKLLIFVFIFCCLVTVKEIFNFVKGVINGKYEISTKRLIILGVSLSFILTVLITGFTLL